MSFVTMPPQLRTLQSALGGMVLPLGILMIVSMLVLPLPILLLDIFFTFNILISLLILMIALHTYRPLDFSSFPSLLLVATVLRLALNVASTRIVLSEGHNGTAAAGKVIEAFGAFVIGGNFVVGIFVFIILVIINLVVITKGAGRVSEVSARFTLDAMPGKQMAIDADLNSGLIGQEDARERRADVAREASFYGAMDGASKFVRGDAIAGILILFINVIGGFSIGILQYNLSADEAATNYILLTIGDGLVAQIPSLLLSVAAALIVTRVGSAADIGGQISEQILQSPKVFYITAGIIGSLGMVPGMPNMIFLFISAVLLLAGYNIGQGTVVEEDKSEDVVPRSAEELEIATELSWDDVLGVDIIGLEVGYRLISLVDQKQGGELLGRIKGIRKKISQDLGFLVHSVHIHDNLNLPPNGYRITLLDVPVASGEVHPGLDMAINPGQVFGELDGVPGKDPAFDLDTVWIEPGQKEEAQAKGYTVVDCSTVIATHLSHALRTHAYELLGHDEVQKLLDSLAQKSPKLVENLIPDILPLGTILKVMQNLLEESIPIRDTRSIVEALAEYGVNEKNSDLLTTAVRNSIGRTICQSVVGAEAEIKVITLQPDMERLLLDSVGGENVTGLIGIEPGLAETLLNEIQASTQELEASGQTPVILVSDRLRPWLSRFARGANPRLRVLAYTEIANNKRIEVVSTLGQLGIKAA